MLANAPAHTTIAVVELDRAEKFYGEVLGLKFISRDMGGATYAAGGDTQIFLYNRGASKADHTVVSFDVTDMEATVSGLKSRGVVFEEYDMPQLKTVDGIATMGDGDGKAAWFKDTEGNILAIAARS